MAFRGGTDSLKDKWLLNNWSQGQEKERQGRGGVADSLNNGKAWESYEQQTLGIAKDGENVSSAFLLLRESKSLLSSKFCFLAFDHSHLSSFLSFSLFSPKDETLNCFNNYWQFSL